MVASSFWILFVVRRSMSCRSLSSFRFPIKSCDLARFSCYEFRRVWFLNQTEPD